MLHLFYFFPLSEDGKIVTSVVLQGRRGVWRYQKADLDASEADVDAKIQASEPFQPEEWGYVAVEIANGINVNL